MNRGKYVLKIKDNFKNDSVTTNRKVNGDKGQVLLTVLLDIVGEMYDNGAKKKDVYAIIDDIYNFKNLQKEEM